MRGWAQYFRYANNATRRFTYLVGVVYWLTAHYLGRKYRRSVRRVMRTRYGVDPKSGKKALYIAGSRGKRVFIPLLARFESGLDLRVGLKVFLKGA